MISGSETVLEMHDQSQSARLVYLALREGTGAMTAGELADVVGISRPAAGRTAKELTDAGWARETKREQSGRGPTPSEWVALVKCEYCDERRHPNGIGSHEEHCDEKTITSYDVQDMDPEDIGLDDDKPEPKRGVQ